MKRITTKVSLWLLGLASLAILAPTKASAVLISTVEVHVSIASSKSVSLQASSTYYAFGAMPLSSATVASSSITVTNDSGAFVETYILQGAAAISDTLGTNWSLATTTGTNQYALGAMFSSSRPADTQTVWPTGSTSLYLTGTPQTCSTTQFGDSSAGDEGAGVSPVVGSRDRYLWFRMHTPSVSTGTEGRTAQVYISVQ